MTADAWATALLAAGPERAQAVVAERGEAAGIEVLLLIDAGDGQITEWVTPGFQRRFAAAP
jgi:thiamine biosynthesis lipoprotein ApbE